MPRITDKVPVGAKAQKSHRGKKLEWKWEHQKFQIELAKPRSTDILERCVVEKRHN
jgi:hypothetical protein